MGRPLVSRWLRVLAKQRPEFSSLTQFLAATGSVVLLRADVEVEHGG